MRRAVFITFFGSLFLLIAVPMALEVRQTISRNKQRHTMSKLSQWAQLLEAYANRHATYPRPGSFGHVAELRQLLDAKDLDGDDGWGHPILYHVSRNMYALRATARDGRDDHQMAPSVTHDDDADFLYANGVFVRVPTEICGGIGEKDEWDVKKYGECAECHPRHVRRLVTK